MPMMTHDLLSSTDLSKSDEKVGMVTLGFQLPKV